MYRIHWPDGALSDMANLSRAKDAAMAICIRASHGRDRNLLHWKKRPRENGATASPVCSRDWPATPLAAGAQT
jgi:hypothetical protein